MSDDWIFCKYMYWDELLRDWCCKLKDRERDASYSPCFLEVFKECDSGGPFDENGNVSLDLMRSMLMDIETAGGAQFNSSYSDSEIQCIEFMVEANLINGTIFYSVEGFYAACIDGLTADGLMLLNSIREDEIYSKTRDYVGESFTIDLVMKTAEMLKLKRIEKRIEEDGTHKT